MVKDYKTELNEIWQLIAEDDPGDYAINDVIQLAKKVNHKDIVDCVREKFGTSSFEMHYLARAGIKEVEKYLISNLELKDEEEVFWASVGLAHLGYPEAFKVLKQFADRSHPLSNFIHPFGDVLEELKKMNHQRAIELVSSFEKGAFGKATDK